MSFLVEPELTLSTSLLPSSEEEEDALKSILSQTPFPGKLQVLGLRGTLGARSPDFGSNDDLADQSKENGDFVSSGFLEITSGVGKCVLPWGAYPFKKSLIPGRSALDIATAAGFGLISLSSLPSEESLSLSSNSGTYSIFLPLARPKKLE